ncbi:MAG: aquaporin [Candidatus Nanopelagicales bacterium]
MSDSTPDTPQPQGSAPTTTQAPNYLAWVENEVTTRVKDFEDPRQEWRRVISEIVGTFFLVTVAAGAPMVGAKYPGTVGLAMAVVAPGLMVMGVIMFMGKVSGAHLNPAVTLAFSLRRDFPWRRVPAYVIAQVVGACLAALMLTHLVGVSSTIGGSYPGAETSPFLAMCTEALLTFGLVSVILGTASGAQSVGLIAATAVAAYISLAGLWAAPLSGASMNPARTLGPNLVGGDLGPYWVYLVGPLLGAVFAVGFAFVLRGSGGGRTGSLAAQGDLYPEISKPDKI